MDPNPEKKKKPSTRKAKHFIVEIRFESIDGDGVPQILSTWAYGSSEEDAIARWRAYSPAFKKFKIVEQKVLGGDGERVDQSHQYFARRPQPKFRNIHVKD